MSRLKQPAVLFIAIAVAAILGAEKAGLYSATSTYDTQFEWEWDHHLGALKLTTDVGSPECWLDLEIKTTRATVATFNATLGEGVGLQVGHERATSPKVWKVSIHPADHKEDSPKLFRWWAGLPIRVFSDPASRLEVVDWRFWGTDKKGSDSASKARCRAAWRAFSFVALVISGLLSIYAGIGVFERKPRQFTPASCLKDLVDGLTIKNLDKKRTNQARKLLRLLLDGVKPEVAVGKVGWTEAERRRYWTPAQMAVRDELQAVLDEFARYNDIVVGSQSILGDENV